MSDWLVIPIFFLLFFSAVTAVVRIRELVARKKPMRSFIDASGCFHLRCGLRIGSLTVSNPIGQIEIGMDNIRISYLGKSIDLGVSDIGGVKFRRGFVGSGVTIRHARSDIPKEIVIWTRFHRQVIGRLSGEI